MKFMYWFCIIIHWLCDLWREKGVDSLQQQPSESIIIGKRGRCWLWSLPPPKPFVTLLGSWLSSLLCPWSHILHHFHSSWLWPTSFEEFSQSKMGTQFLGILNWHDHGYWVHSLDRSFDTLEGEHLGYNALRIYIYAFISLEGSIWYSP